jgi:prepilin-type processing-associated H-X9-DG protein
VELLVVIGIIAVLISILLPAIGGARRQARLVECGSNLRTLMQACQMHAQEHSGYLPLAGAIVMPPTASVMNGEYASALSDGRRKRYSYAKLASGFGNKFTPMPLPAALAPYLGVTLRTDDFYEMDQELNESEGVWRRFMCPDTDAWWRPRMKEDTSDTNLIAQGMMMIPYAGPTWLSWWAHNSDYGFNEGIFGFHYDPRYARNRLAGNLARIRRPSEVAVFTDAIPRKTLVVGSPCGWICWTPSPDGPGQATLGDAMAGNGRVEAGDMFDPKRHGKRMNIAFADGHVETVGLAKDDLDKAYLVPPQ